MEWSRPQLPRRAKKTPPAPSEPLSSFVLRHIPASRSAEPAPRKYKKLFDRRASLFSPFLSPSPSLLFHPFFQLPNKVAVRGGWRRGIEKNSHGLEGCRRGGRNEERRERARKVRLWTSFSFFPAEMERKVTKKMMANEFH